MYLEERVSRLEEQNKKLMLQLETLEKCVKLCLN